MKTSIDEIIKPEVLQNFPDKPQLFLGLCAKLGAVDSDKWETEPAQKLLIGITRLGNILCNERDYSVELEQNVSDAVWKQIQDLKADNDRSIEKMTEYFQNRNTRLSEKDEKELAHDLAGQVINALKDYIPEKPENNEKVEGEFKPIEEIPEFLKRGAQHVSG
jgi:DNA mismatch repair ATPase MutS